MTDGVAPSPASGTPEQLGPDQAGPDRLGGRRPFWKNPFVLALFVGIVTLTVLPFLQRQTLRAPPPLAKLKPWGLTSMEGTPVTNSSLKGKVWIASFCQPPCQAAVDLSRMGKHLEDLGDQVLRLTFVAPGQGSYPRSEDRRWLVVTGPPELLDRVISGFGQALAAQTAQASGSRTTVTMAELTARPSYALVDQEGQIRGFWPADEVGEGNVINAARMLARYGPSP